MQVCTSHPPPSLEPLHISISALSEYIVPTVIHSVCVPSKIMKVSD
jgi:hypothetical protein